MVIPYGQFLDDSAQVPNYLVCLTGDRTLLNLEMRNEGKKRKSSLQHYLPSRDRWINVETLEGKDYSPVELYEGTTTLHAFLFLLDTDFPTILDSKC